MSAPPQLTRIAAQSRKALMRPRISPIVTTIVTVIVTLAAPIVTPVSAQVLTVCANPIQSSVTPDRFPSRQLADVIIPLSGRANTDGDALIALWQDDRGYDILVNWGESGQHSLRADGAQIIGMAPNSELVHLMVAHADGDIEQFLFNLDTNGSGELLRSAAGDASVSSKAVCVEAR